MLYAKQKDPNQCFLEVPFNSQEATSKRKRRLLKILINLWLYQLIFLCEGYLKVQQNANYFLLMILMQSNPCALSFFPFKEKPKSFRGAMHKANQKWKVLINLMFLMQSKPFRGYFASRKKCQTFGVYQKNVSCPLSHFPYAFLS